LICGNGSVILVAMKITFAQMALLCFALAPANFCTAQDVITPTNHIELFNAKDFSGWTFCMKNNADPMQTWSVTNGVIHCSGQPYGYARTEKSFRDYQLTVVWRFVKITPHADNSGIFVHIQLPDKVFPECFECQGQFRHQGDLILSGGTSIDGPQPNGNKATFIPQIGSPNENPAGQWNTNRVACRGSTIELTVNGRTMNKINGCNVSSGFIGIQSEGGEIEVRKVSLEPLK
jgi:Domain of Unknown Function (DUF1080)